MNLKDKLWVEKYRPKTIADYVFVDEHQRELVESWIADGSIPNLLFSGEPGTGKTSLSKVLINELRVNPYDVLEINASRENGVDIIRDKILGFVQTMPFGAFKVVLLDEADHLTAAGQAMLRSDIETYSNTARFILTCNYPHRIIPALRKSRLNEITINKSDKTEFTARAATVLLSESIEFELETLERYVDECYPDMRKCLNTLQLNSKSGTLVVADTNIREEDSALTEISELFRAGKILDGRQQLLHFLALNPTRAEDLYVWMYKNLDLWGNTQERKDAAIITIRNGLANLSLVGIPEISIAATLVELTQ